jgi:hypothetical protein
MAVLCTRLTEGAQSLRSCKGDGLLRRCRLQVSTKPFPYAFVVPALRKVREGRGSHFVGDAGGIRRRGRPSSTSEPQALKRGLILAA